MLSWLSSVNPYSDHDSARDKCGTSTGHWFINCGKFLQWLQEKQGSLWLTGIPGAGKTVLLSTVIDCLLWKRKVNEAVVIFYFTFSDGQKKMLDALLRSVLSQACALLDEIPSEVMHSFRTSQGGSRLSFDRNTLLWFLKNVLASFDSFTMVIDALDESSDVPSVLVFLQDLKSTGFESVKWLVTSRQQQAIEYSLLSIKTPVVILIMHSCKRISVIILSNA